MHVGLHVALQLAGLRTGMITQLALIRLLSCVASPVHYQVALELEGLPTEFTGFALVLCLWWRGAVWGHWWQWRGVQEG